MQSSLFLQDKRERVRQKEEDWSAGRDQGGNQRTAQRDETHLSDRGMIPKTSVFSRDCFTIARYLGSKILRVLRTPRVQTETEAKEKVVSSGCRVHSDGREAGGIRDMRTHISVAGYRQAPLMGNMGIPRACCAILYLWT